MTVFEVQPTVSGTGVVGVAVFAVERSEVRGCLVGRFGGLP